MYIKRSQKIMSAITDKLRHLYFCTLTLISPKLNTKAKFKKTYGRPVDLENPKSFNEKGMYLKLNYYNKSDFVKKCADKYAVREYIKEKGCESILNDLIAVYDRVDDIDFATLPDAFVIKWNFGCGYNLVCPDKSKLDIEAAKKKLKKWGRKKFHLHFSEMQYKIKNKKLIVEKFLKPQNGNLPDDYKIYCFNGKAKYVMVCQERDSGETKCYFFDRDWNLARINERGKEAPEGFTLEKPVNMDEMFEYAEKLSENIPFVRVDFFSCDGKTVFGEMTFTPAGYLDPNYLPETEKLFGDMIDINNVKI